MSDVSSSKKTANSPIIVVAQQESRFATIFEDHQDSNCETTSEVRSPVVSHARLGQTPVGRASWTFSVTTGPAKSGPGPNKGVVLLEGLKSH